MKTNTMQCMVFFIGGIMKKYILLIFLVAFNLRLGISSVPPILALIKDDLLLNNFQASMLTSLPVVVMGVMAFFVGMFQEKIGRNKSITIFLLVLGVGACARYFINTYLGLLFTAFLIGFGIAIVAPLISGFIKEEFEKTGVVVGIYSLGISFGSMCCSGVVLKVARYFDNSWNEALSIWGIFGITAAIIWAICIPRETNYKKKEKVKLPLKNILVWKMVLVFGLQSGVFYNITTWLPDFFISKGLIAEESVKLVLIFTISHMIFSFVVPALVQKVGSVKIGIFLCSVAIIIGSCMLLNGIFVMGLMIISIGTGGIFPIAVMLPIEYGDNPDEVSVWTAMMQGFGYIIGGLTPLIVGFIIDKTNSYNILVFALVVLSLFFGYIGVCTIKKPLID